MAKKVYLAITILMILALLSGIPHLIDGICARSMTEVNYGIVGFPIFIGIWSFYKYKKQNKPQKMVVINPSLQY